MNSKSLLIIGVLAVALVAVLAVLLPGLSAPQSPVQGEDELTPAPTPTSVPVTGNGTYVNTTYGYAVTCPEGGSTPSPGEAYGSPRRISTRRSA
jgi:hypothetical protein